MHVDRTSTSQIDAFHHVTSTNWYTLAWLLEANAECSITLFEVYVSQFGIELELSTSQVL